MLRFFYDPSAQLTPAPAEQVLVKQAKSNPNLFGELYRRHVNQVYRYLLARVGHVQDAQDLTSQTFLTALENLPSYRGDGAFAAWLLSIARHKVADHYRRRKLEEPLDELENEGDAGISLDDSLTHKLQLEQIARKLQLLAPDRAEALRLRIFGELSVAEIAPLMHKNEAAVRMLVHRGLKDLQQQLTFKLEEVT